LETSPNFSPESVAGSQNNGPTRIRQGLREKKETTLFAFAAFKANLSQPRLPCRYIQRPAARRLESVRSDKVVALFLERKKEDAADAAVAGRHLAATVAGSFS
jgi:hypothetical protein